MTVSSHSETNRFTLLLGQEEEVEEEQEEEEEGCFGRTYEESFSLASCCSTESDSGGEIRI